MDLPKTSASNSLKYFTPDQSVRFLECLEKEYAIDYGKRIRKDSTGKQYNVAGYTEIKPIPLQFKVFYNIALFGGLRRGEILGLTWEDIDFNVNKIHINKSVALLNNKPIVKATKNLTSNRSIVLPVTVMKLIKQYKMEYMQYRFQLGDQWAIDENGKMLNYLFIQWNGSIMHPSTPTHKFREILIAYNKSVTNAESKLPLITLHDLRHTSATLLISQNVNIRSVSGRLGHAQTSTTLNIYAHAIQELDQSASDSLENLLVKHS